MFLFAILGVNLYGFMRVALLYINGYERSKTKDEDFTG